jgi:hypothetical protein
MLTPGQASFSGRRVFEGYTVVAELRHQFGISRETACKWIARQNDGGPVGLEDRSCAPHNHPNRIPQVSIEALVQARGAYPHWGTRKILAWLERALPELDALIDDERPELGLIRPPVECWASVE